MLRRVIPESGAGERGSVLIAVIGVMAVLVIVTLTVTSSSLQSLGLTTSVLAGVQAQAAAEAGIAAGVVQLSTGCPLVEDNRLRRSAPQFEVIFSHLDSGAPVWEEGCPAAMGQVKMVSTGTAGAAGLGGKAAGTTRSVEAVYSVAVSGSSPSAGIAIYADLGFSIIESVTIHAPGAAIYVRQGDASCISSGANTVDLIVHAGDVILGESCGLFGDVWASGNATIGGSALVHQSLIAARLTTSSTAQVSGNVWVSGLAAIGPGTVVGGSLTAGETSGILGSLIGNSSQTKPGPVSGLAAPGWYDLKYKYSSTIGTFVNDKSQKDMAWNYFENKVVLGGICDLAALQAAADALTGAPGIIECANGVDVSGTGILNLGSDIAIIADNFQFRNSAQIDAASKHKLWLVTSDKSPNSKSKCNAKAEDFSVIESFKVNFNVDVMVYTPCNVNISTSSQWRGQIWGGTVKLATSGVYTYAEVGFPGATSTGGGTPALGARESIRDLNG
ncbi:MULTISPECIES: hypothetical protein [unclassified Cryobacterium]|uniref:hypothetical protein n=1 Tax=unclassified Cryobacterium TaxID=2649013 RepID=UPI000CE4C89A|nr:MULTISPECIES: hypothetical protein [unclassified Cryobacterium]